MTFHPEKNPRGSEWRIWDLHVHTPASYGGSFEDFITNASNSEAAVIGINDYATIEGYEKILDLGGVPGKVIFPVVELRMHNVLITKHNSNGVHVNFHIIFDNDPNLLPTIKTFVDALECLDKSGTKQLLGDVAQRKEVTADSHHVIQKLRDLSLLEKHALVWIPYDEYGGIDEIDPINDPNFKASLISDAHFLGSSNPKQISFFKWEDPRYSEDQYRGWFKKRKPCIKGSDAHKINYPFGRLQNSKSEPIERYCWIKADPTFSGLKQVVHEPDRIFIGKEPQLLTRTRENPTKFIRLVKVGLHSGESSNDIWFDDIEIELNSSLVAIIGNKGSGKSALTDIIGLCGNTHQEIDNFSFLTSEKFRKRYPENLSTKFRGAIIWEDGSEQSRLLSENPDGTQPERVRYIPQHFFEKVCSTVESGEFENELKHIVFSHTPLERRLGRNTLDELIDHKSALVDAQIQDLKSDIANVNREIVAAEEMAMPEFRAILEGQIRLIDEELAAHDKIKPQPPTLSDDQAPTGSSNIESQREAIHALEREIKALSDERVSLYLKSDDLSRAISYFEDLDRALKAKLSLEDPYVSILRTHDIAPADVLTFSINTAPIKVAKDIIDSRLAILDSALDQNRLDSKPRVLESLNSQLTLALEELDRPARIQQQYQSDLEAWNRKREQILGDPLNDNSYSSLTAKLQYIQSELSNVLGNLYKQRNEKLRTLLNRKFELRKIRQELFDPVTAFVNNFPEIQAGYDVQLDVSLRIQDFPTEFFRLISQGKIGSFQGTEEGHRRLLDIIEESTVETEDGAVAFVDKVLDNLRNDYRVDPPSLVQPAKQLKKGVELRELYDLLFQCDYIVPSYDLKLGNKHLSELSPGERGALLLIFYLLLDNDDTPLILDQPEDNLDNESIFLVLVKFIKRVKDERQIVIVTHNPNLAIVCDAEQIIHCQIEKNNRNKVVFSTGSIEDLTINRTSINILEGTLPAFDNRDSKYIRPEELRTPLSPSA